MTAPAPSPADTGEPRWHPDPWGRHQLRFFDGRLWTEHVADGPVAGLDTAPVADRPRSRPPDASIGAPDGTDAPRVLDAGPADPDDTAGREPLADPVLLLDGEPDADGVRRLWRPDDSPAGAVAVGRPRLLTRAVRLLAAAPTDDVTRLVVRDAAGGELLRLSRPARRTAPVVDVDGPAGRLGAVAADRVRTGLHARVVDAAGEELGTLAESARRPGPGASPPAVLTLTGADGRLLARLAAVWDVPGSRRHLPPGTLVVDRRELAAADPGRGAEARGDGDGGSVASRSLLALAALLAPTLLRPPSRP